MAPRHGSSPRAKSLLLARCRNKLRRQALLSEHGRARSLEERQTRLHRRKAEDNDPTLRRQRQARNVPATQESKRLWDADADTDADAAGRLGARVDVERLQRRHIFAQLRDEAAPPPLEGEERQHPLTLEEGQQQQQQPRNEVEDEKAEEQGAEDDRDSMLAPSDSEDADNQEDDGRVDDGDEDEDAADLPEQQRVKRRRNSAALSTTSTNIDLTAASLAARFPALYAERPSTPKVLVTTSLQSTLHAHAELLCTLFPNSHYVPRSAHHYGHAYSLREISGFAARRDYTAVVVLREDHKKPNGLTIICLPAGPTFTFSISNWMDGKKLPGHGNPTNHYPELLLNNFKTPLGLLAARLFLTLFPPQPELQGRQVVTLHNQRDFIFVRRHRYVFRDRRPTERSIAGSDGRHLAGVEGIRAGIQELGPRFTLRLRRLDRGIGLAGSSGPDALLWQWRSKMDKRRQAFNL